MRNFLSCVALLVLPVVAKADLYDITFVSDIGRAGGHGTFAVPTDCTTYFVLISFDIFGLAQDNVTRNALLFDPQLNFLVGELALFDNPFDPRDGIIFSSFSSGNWTLFHAAANTGFIIDQGHEIIRPVPEPASIVLMLSALCAVCMIAKKSSRSCATGALPPR
jgi:hypothetical protein